MYQLSTSIVYNYRYVHEQNTPLNALSCTVGRHNSERDTEALTEAESLGLNSPCVLAVLHCLYPSATHAALDQQIEMRMCTSGTIILRIHCN